MINIIALHPRPIMIVEIMLQMNKYENLWFCGIEMAEKNIESIKKDRMLFVLCKY